MTRHLNVFAVECHTHGFNANFNGTREELMRAVSVDVDGRFLFTCPGCVEARRNYTCTTRYQKRAEKRRRFLRFAKAMRACAFTVELFGHAARQAKGSADDFNAAMRLAACPRPNIRRGIKITSWGT